MPQLRREYFIDRYIERAIPLNFEMKIVPTYRCNLSCVYCYAHVFKRQYPGDMSGEVFARLIDAFVQEGGRSVRILGGEPGLWPELGRAVTHLRERKLKSIVLTNGTMPLDELPDEIHLNIEHYYEGALRDAVVSTLASYEERDALVRFRYNVQPNEPAEKMGRILDLAATYGIPSLHLGTAWPHERTPAFGRQVIEAVRMIRRRGFGCTLGDPMPFCMFTEEERDELCDTANFSGRCMCGHIPLVNPDGSTVFPCQAVPAARPLDELSSACTPSSLSLRDVHRAFRHDVGHVVRAIDDECRGCEHYLSGDCQNGCLGNRVSLVREMAAAGSLADVTDEHALVLHPDIGPIRRGDGLSAFRSSGERSSELCQLLGLPGETVAITPEGDVFVQNAHVPTGAEIVLNGASAVPPGLVNAAAVYDIGERDVLLIPCGDRTAKLRSEPGLFVTSSSSIACKEAATGAVANQWSMTPLASRVRAAELALRRESASGKRRLAVDLSLTASRGTIVEVSLEDERTRRLVARRHVFQETDGAVRHSLMFDLEGAWGRGRACRAGLHAAGVLLAFALEDSG
jgi:MoaA/NifB/PqqE/SkfB family radical SAM enzyme